MFVKQLVLSGFLLLSAAAPLCAMDAYMATEDNSSDMQFGAAGLEGSDSIVESAETEELAMAPVGEDMAMYSDTMAMDSEQPTSMKKKMAPIAEDMSVVQEQKSEESQPSMMDDDVDNQKHADVQGVFESMTREEEDESFPG
jgi:hypothetical protein